MRRLFSAFALCVGCFTSSTWAEDIVFEFDERLFDEVEFEGPKPNPTFLDDLLPETQESIRKSMWRDQFDFEFPDSGTQPFGFCIASN